jgi:hypothetical protein
MVDLLITFGSALSFPLFDRADPGAWGTPSFIWYQFLWIPGSALVISLVCFKTTSQLRPLG